MKGAAVFAVSFVMILAVAVLAWRGGRTYCNAVCPVGTVLGMLSRFSLFRITVDTSKCNGCTLCARNCKVSCIDAKAHRVDASRCVMCFDCLDKCSRGAIGYRFAYGKKAVRTEPVSAGRQKPVADEGNGRRAFIAGTAVMFASAVSAQVAKKVEPVKMGGWLTSSARKSRCAPLRSLLRVRWVRATCRRIAPPASFACRSVRTRCSALRAGSIRLCSLICRTNGAIAVRSVRNVLKYVPPAPS